MVTVVEGDNSWADAFRDLGSGLVKGYTNRSDEMALQKAVQDLGPNASARDIINAVTGAKTYGNESKQNFFKNVMGAEKLDLLQKQAKTQQDIATAKKTIADAKAAEETNKPIRERNNVKNIVNELDIPEDQKVALGEALSQSAAEDLLKQQLKPENTDKLTPFQKKVQEKNAEEYINLTKEIPKIESTLGDIAYARQLSNELGTSGTVGGALGLSKKAKELEGVSFTLMEPIVKIFNPSGPIAQQKLKMIQDKYVISASDAPWTKKAKLDALERFAKQALGRAQQKLELIKKYDGNPPESVINNFDKESDTISDAMLDYDIIGEEANIPNLPPAGEYKGEEIESADGTTYLSDGTRWLKK
jgi:hypothetical protein